MHFDYFGPAMLTIFMAMIGGWVDPMTFAFDVVGISSIVFFVIVVVVGFFIIMNLFVSILLEAFGGDDEEEEAEPEPEPEPEPES